MKWAPSGIRAAPTAATTPAGVPDDWRVLLGLNLYRMLLVTGLLAIQQTGVLPDFFPDGNAGTFKAVCIGYAIAALLLILPWQYRRPSLTLQALANLATDIVFLVVLVSATGGVPGGLAMLLVPPVLAVSLLLTPRLALAAAASATMALFLQELLRYGPWFGTRADYAAAGVMGLMFFATAIAANAVAQRARKSEAFAELVGSEFEDLARLNQTVLETMLTGVAVVDHENRLRTLNPSAAELLQAPQKTVGEPLASYSQPLHDALLRWRSGAATQEGPIAPVREGASELLPRFRRLHRSPTAPVLILLEDAARVRDQAQQIKLAALGRLSASIAHEIRNPLSAIHHAAQLLDEACKSGELNSATDAKLIDIIQRHSRRIDVIVRDVLNLSRPAGQSVVLDLSDWLPRALGTYSEAKPQQTPQLLIEPKLRCQFDPNHLQQVLFNLLDNAWLHGRSNDAPPEVTVRARRIYAQGGFLEVEDNGPGVSKADAQHLFEPFFTTTTSGSGLGLYLARELCAYNQAKLTLHDRRGGGAVFRITFVSPEESPTP